jgi:hypothetical protein
VNRDALRSLFGDSACRQPGKQFHMRNERPIIWKWAALLLRKPQHDPRSRLRGGYEIRLADDKRAGDHDRPTQRREIAGAGVSVVRSKMLLP